MKKKKAERKEKGLRYEYLVVREDDVRVPKYLPTGSGVTFEHASALAEPVASQVRYVPLRLELWDFFRDAREAIPVSLASVLWRDYLLGGESND